MRQKRNVVFVLFQHQASKSISDGSGYDEIALYIALVRDDEGRSLFRAIGTDFVLNMPQRQQKCHSANPTKWNFLDSLAGSLMGSLIDSKISISVDWSVAVERQRPILRVHQISTPENIQWKLGP